ncbi:glycosyltransferase family 4 protein [Halobacteriaceae archaeon GCM10025711]
MSPFEDDMSRKKNILYFINSLHTGGAEIGMCRLLNGLNKDKYNVTVVVLNGYSSNLLKKTPDWVTVLDMNLSQMRNFSEFHKLIRLARDADLIVGSLFHSVLAASVFGMIDRSTTVALWQHNEVFKTELRKYLFKISTYRADVVLADSEPVASMLIGETGLKEDLVHTVPIAGLDLDKYTQVNHETTDDIVVGTVGRLVKQKNHRMILAVADRFQGTNISFEIVGSGKLYEKLSAKIENRQLSNITLHGAIEDVPQFLAGLDIYFQPSLHEGLCITVLEAMAAGLPVVGSDVGGIGRNVEHGENGFLYEPNNADGFVSGIETLATDPQLRRRFGEKGRKTVAKSFTQEVLVTEFEKAIQRR